MSGDPSPTRVRSRLRGLWRLSVPVAALVALALGAARPVTGGLALAGLALAGERLVALRRTGSADRVLVGVGGSVVALVLTGLALDAAGVGLRPTSWVVAVAVLSVLGAVIAQVLPDRGGPPADPAAVTAVGYGAVLRAVPWLALAAVVAVVAVRMSTTSLTAADAPPLQMSFGRVAGTQVQVVVTSTDPVGPLEVRTSAGGDDLSYPLFRVGRDGSRTTTVALPRTGRFVITLNYPDQTQPLRTLVLDR